MHDVEFQTNAMSVDYCVEQSRLVQLYTAAELRTLKRIVVCPCCGTYVRNSIHIFEHGLIGSRKLKSRSIDELASIGSATPFLLLEHPLRETFSRRSGISPQTLLQS